MRSSMRNGGVSLRLKICACATCTSTSPVGSLGFTFAPRETTFPRTPTQYSRRSSWARSCSSLPASSSKTTWVRPARSRRSMTTAPPWSRRLCTQPKRITSLPTSLAVSSPQVWVRFKSRMNSATYSSLPGALRLARIRRVGEPASKRAHVLLLRFGSGVADCHAHGTLLPLRADPLRPAAGRRSAPARAGRAPSFGSLERGRPDAAGGDDGRAYGAPTAGGGNVRSGEVRGRPECAEEFPCEEGLHAP